MHKYCGSLRAANEAIEPDVALAVCKFLAHAKDHPDPAQFLASVGLLLLAYNMKYQCAAEGRPSEEIAKEWSDALLGLTRKISVLIEGRL